MTDKAPDLSPTAVERSLDERYDTQMEVERDPYGAWMAIQSLAARVDALMRERTSMKKTHRASLDRLTKCLIAETERANAQRDEARAEWSRLLKRANENYARATKAEVAVDALTKERDSLSALREAEVEILVADLNDALARLGAVERETLDLRGLINAAQSIFLNCEVIDGCCCCGDSMGAHSDPMQCGHSPVDHGRYQADKWLERSEQIAPLNPEAAAALDRAIAKAVQEERRACAEVVKKHPMRFAGQIEPVIRDSLAVAILARGAKQEDGE